MINPKPSFIKLCKMTTHPEILGEGRFLKLIRKNNWEYVERRNISGIVVILAITPDHKILFTEQYRPPVEKKVIELPAGLAGDISGMEEESLLQAAQRELLEETGYEAGHFQIITEGPTSSGLSNEIITLLLATNLTKRTDGGGDDSEDITVHAIAFENAERWINNQISKGFLADPKIFTGLYFAQKYIEGKIK